MISRRNARVKVMQGIYAHLQDVYSPIQKLKKELSTSVKHMSGMFYYTIYLLIEIAEYANKAAEIKAGKLLKTENDKSGSRKIATDPVISFLKLDPEVLREAKAGQFKHLLDPELIRHWFNTLQSTAQYEAYIEKEKHYKNDPDILTILFKKVLLPDESFHNHMEENFPCWEDDRDPVIIMVKTCLAEIRADKTFNTQPLLKEKSGEIEKFALELFDKTIEHLDEYAELIAPKLTNWEIDRIALMDMILMRMALTEIIDFPSIPVKVTMNEYIDISKRYSTPKSREFINGVLDNLSKELKETGKIKKTGRGLLET